VTKPPHYPLALLAVAGTGVFVASATGMTRAPFLLQMSHDLAVDLVMVSHLLSVTAVTWGVVAFFTGRLGALFGRRRVMMGGQVLLGLTMIGFALATAYWQAVLYVAVGGAACGAYMGTVFGEVADRVADSMRGRAMGWVIGGQSLALLLGVPAASWAGAFIGWRGVSVAIGLAAFAVAVVTRFLFPSAPARVVGSGGAAGLAAALRPRIVALLGASITERTCFGLVATFFATYLQLAHGFGLAELALPLALVAAGNFLGNLVGGRLSDAVRDRAALYAATSVGTGAVAVALFVASPGTVGAIGLGVLYGVINGMSRPALISLLSGVPPEVRGTVLGINISCASVGWVTSALAGGAFAAAGNWVGLGWTVAVLGVVGAVLGLAGRSGGKAA
jgi:predicted MFS family arabinose efflux permease